MYTFNWCARVFVAQVLKAFKHLVREFASCLNDLLTNRVDYICMNRRLYNVHEKIHRRRLIIINDDDDDNDKKDDDERI